MMIALYAAVAENGVIGRDGDLPWRLSTDMKRFKAGTLGKPIIMGRKTWESFPRRPLPGRLNIVVTRDANYQAEGAEIAASVNDAFDIAKRDIAASEIAVIGGGQIYAQAMPFADRLYITHVLTALEGDTRFPTIDGDHWDIVSSEDFPVGEKDNYPTRYTIYQRAY